MKTKAKNNKKYNAIKTLFKNREEGLKPIRGCPKNLKQVKFTVEDHEDYMMQLSALIEVCVIALDGQGSFTSKSLSHIPGEASVGLVLELVIELLPFDQMFCMDRIEEIIDQGFDDNPNHTAENQPEMNPEGSEKGKEDLEKTD